MSSPRAEQGVDSGEVGATLVELVNGGLNESDLLCIVHLLEPS